MNGKLPKIRKHASGQSVIWLNGHDVYLGKHGSLEAQEKYIRLVRESQVGAPAPPRQPRRKDALTVTELIARFTEKRVEPYYLKDGKPTGEVNNFKFAFKPLERLYGSTPITKFGPRELKAVRADMMANENARNTINRNISRIRQMFRWAVTEELFHPSSLVALQAVEGLERGRSTARETKPIGPADPVAVAKATPLMPIRVQAIVQLIELTGARPGEICQIRPCDVNRSLSPWEYRPASHKTQHHGRDRVILIGPRAQEILSHWLDRKESGECCFCPADAIANNPWEGARRPKPNAPYTSLVLSHTVRSACRRAGVASWHPNQLRHTAATAIRRQFGLESSRVILGHSKASTTEIYAEIDLTEARKVMGLIG